MTTHGVRDTTAPRLLVIGAAGQIGGEVMRQAGGRAVAVTRRELDLCDLVERARSSDSAGAPGRGWLKNTLDATGCHCVLNLAAYTAVDRAETEPELADIINAKAPALLAEEARDLGIPYIQVSTDYVFSGELARPAENPAVEVEQCEATSVYGRTKWEGERAVLAAGGTAVRTSWVYSAPRLGHPSFVATMARLADQGVAPSVVADQWGRPTAAGDLALALLELADALGESAQLPSVIHAAGGGEVTTWHELAAEVFEQTGHDRARVTPIATVDYPTPAPRPLNAALDVSGWQAYGFKALPAWQDSVAASLR